MPYRPLQIPLLVTVLALLNGCVTPDLGDSEAALVLGDFMARGGFSRLQAITPQPSRTTVRYEVDGRSHRGDLYLSSGGSMAGILLVPGVARKGKDDPRLVAAAYTLARVRFAVLVPDMPGPRAFKVRASDVREIADAFSYLVSRVDLVPKGRLGIFAFSYAVGPALLAALEPDIRERVGFLLGLGGYHDLRRAMVFITTGYYRTEETAGWRHKKPNPYAKWIFALSNAELLPDPADRDAFQKIAWNVLREPDLEVAQDVAQMGPEGQALYRLLTNTDPERVPALLDQQAAPIRAQFAALNPAQHDLSRLKARVILLHGRSDNMIPYTESISLARALPAEQVHLFLIDGLAHVDIRPKRGDIPILMQAVEALLSQRAGGPPSGVVRLALPPTAITANADRSRLIPSASIHALAWPARAAPWSGC